MSPGYKGVMVKRRKGKKAKKERDKGLSTLFALSPLRLFPLLLEKRKRGL